MDGGVKIDHDPHVPSLKNPTSLKTFSANGFHGEDPIVQHMLSTWELSRNSSPFETQTLLPPASLRGSHAPSSFTESDRKHLPNATTSQTKVLPGAPKPINGEWSESRRDLISHDHFPALPSNPTYPDVNQKTPSPPSKSFAEVIAPTNIQVISHDFPPLPSNNIQAGQQLKSQADKLKSFAFVVTTSNDSAQPFFPVLSFPSFTAADMICFLDASQNGLVCRLKEENLRLQMASFAHAQHFFPTSNHLI